MHNVKAVINFSCSGIICLQVSAIEISSLVRHDLRDGLASLLTTRVNLSERVLGVVNAAKKKEKTHPFGAVRIL